MRIGSVLVIATRTANAAVWTVTSLGPWGPGSLSGIVAAAGADDTIRFGVTGTIKLETTLLIDKRLAIEGPGSPDLVVLEPGTGEFGRQFQFGIIEVAGGVSPVALSGLTFRNGLSLTGGGALDCSRSTVVVRNCAFLSNTGRSRGGAIVAESCALTVSECTFLANSARLGLPPSIPGSANGGAILSVVPPRSGNQATLYVELCRFDANSAIMGGGAVAGHDLTIRSCTFTRNTSSSAGGVDATGASVISDCTFVENAANRSSGGAVETTYTGSLKVQNRLFKTNSADQGGAIGAAGVVEIENSTFYKNRARRGGAIHLFRGTLSVTGGTFQGNTAIHRLHPHQRGRRPVPRAGGAVPKLLPLRGGQLTEWRGRSRRQSPNHGRVGLDRLLRSRPHRTAPVLPRPPGTMSAERPSSTTPGGRMRISPGKTVPVGTVQGDRAPRGFRPPPLELVPRVRL